jgi:tetratricopeptide (TPR) repeat protein
MFLNTILITLALFSAPLTVKQAVESARADFDAGKYAQVVKNLTSAHDQAPQDSAVAFWLARAYYEQRNYDKAVSYAEEAVRLNSKDGEYYRWLGRIYGAKADQSHSFFLARKVKQAFESAVKFAPRSIEAHRDLMQYLVEAPWIVGGDKDKARKEIDSIAQLDPVEGRLAKAAYLSTDKKWKEAESEYLAIVDQHPNRVEAYMEAAEFFAGRKEASNLERVVDDAGRVNSYDPRLDFYRAVVMVLNRKDLSRAEVLLHSYIDNVPQRSDYPSHDQALIWLRAARS